MTGSNLDRLPSIGLDEVLARAELLNRNDRKYLVPYTTFERFLAGMRDRLSVLQIDGVRRFRYTSIYFDTPSLLTYHQHLQRRRRRYKIRTRTYVDTSTCMLEVKMKGHRDATDKRRISWPARLAGQLTSDGERFAASVLNHELGLPLPRLERTLRIDYQRTTLVSVDGAARYTCDTGIRFVGRRGSADGPSDHVLIEVKSAGSKDPAHRLLWRLGVRPVQMSKYPVAVALLWPGIRANPWSRTIRRYFGVDSR